jgi:hypothetical protein
MTRASDVAKLITNGGTIVDGDIAFASGHGLDFSSTANSSGTLSNELLDDYEEGTFTPTMTDGSTTVNGDSNTGGHYTKVGQMVFVTGHINIDTVSSTMASFGSSAVIKIGGLPFATKADSNFFTRGGGSVGRVDNLDRSASNAIYIAVEPNVSTLDIYIDDSDNENTPITKSQIDSAFRIFFSCTYVS